MEILNNSIVQWVFSGIGTTILSSICSFFFGAFFGRKIFVRIVRIKKLYFSNNSSNNQKFVVKGNLSQQIQNNNIIIGYEKETIEEIKKDFTYHLQQNNKQLNDKIDKLNYNTVKKIGSRQSKGAWVILCTPNKPIIITLHTNNNVGRINLKIVENVYNPGDYYLEGGGKNSSFFLIPTSNHICILISTSYDNYILSAFQ